jgi:adenylyltransferase/sulfurtransferase
MDYQQFCGLPHPENQKEKSMSDAIGLMSVQELQKRLNDKKPDFILVDVREENEYEIAHIEGAVLKPLSRLEFEYQDLSKNKEIAIHCRTGGRSMRACQFLQTQGYTKLYNVTGGITAWAQEIDPQVPIY